MRECVRSPAQGQALGQHGAAGGGFLAPTLHFPFWAGRVLPVIMRSLPGQHLGSRRCHHRYPIKMRLLYIVVCNDNDSKAWGQTSRLTHDSHKGRSGPYRSCADRCP